MSKNNNNAKITFKFGCTVPIVALLCLLALLEIIKWKTAIVIGLCILILPLAIWLIVASVIGLGGIVIGVAALVDKFKK